MFCRWEREIEPGDPWTNMASDAAMLAALVDDQAGLPTVRVYQWDRPSVSIGRLQNEEAVSLLYPGRPCVRRPTGGRAVLHGNDLTITVAVRSDCMPEHVRHGTLASYRQIMAGVVTALRSCGISAAFASSRENRRTAQIVNCFDIAAGCDLIDSRSGRKIAGSAQRRERDAILQQTSLPLEFLPDVEAFIQQLQSGLQDALSVGEWLIN